MKIPRLLAIVALTAIGGAHAGPVDPPVAADENPDRFVIHDGALAISRPDESWKFEVDGSEPHVVGRLVAPDEAAVVDVQLQRVPGATLDQLKQPIEQALAAEVQDFIKLSGGDVEIRGIAAYVLTIAATVEGTPVKAKLLVYKPSDTLYLVKCRSSSEDWERFEPTCDKVLTGFEILVEQRRRFIPTDRYESRTIEGWTVHVNRDLLADDTEVGGKALKLLQAKLFELGRVVPEKACEELRRIPIWLGVEDGHAPGAEYHWSREWLEAHGYNPDKARAVEIGNASRFLATSIDQPGVVLHELAHGYHDRVLGYDHGGIGDAYRAAVEGGSYESVLRIDGSEARAYALVNAQEYFAEGTEAYFGTNDFYPFVRVELLRHDPRLFELLEEVWGSGVPDRGAPE